MFLSNWVINKKNVWTKPNIRSNACISMHKPVSTSFSQHWKSATCSLGSEGSVSTLLLCAGSGTALQQLAAAGDSAPCPGRLRKCWEGTSCESTASAEHRCSYPGLATTALRPLGHLEWDEQVWGTHIKCKWTGHFLLGKLLLMITLKKCVECAKDSKVTSRCNCMFWIFKPTASLLCIARSFSFHSGLQILSLSTCLLKAAPIKK